MELRAALPSWKKLPQQHRKGRGVSEGETDPTWLQVLPLGWCSGARGAMGASLGAAAGARPRPDRKLPATGWVRPNAQSAREGSA